MAGSSGLVLRKLNSAGSWTAYPYSAVVNGGSLIDDASGVKTPNYGYLSSNGFVLPVNTYERFVSDGWPCRKYYSMQHGEPLRAGASWYESEFALNAYTTPLNKNDIKLLFTDQITAARNEANTLFQRRLKNVTWDMAVDVGEINQTVMMIADRVRSTVEFARDWRAKTSKLYTDARRILISRPSKGYRGKSRYDRLRPYLDDINGTYKEFTLGWNPLVASLEDAFMTGYDLVEGISPRVKVSAHAFRVDTDDTKLSGASGPYSAHGAYNFIRRTQLRTDVWAGGLLKSPDTYGEWNRRLGLTLGNAVPVLWELTRYSFLFDYFMNIGDLMNNFSGALQTVQQRTSYISQKCSYSSYILISNIDALKSSTSVEYHLESIKIEEVSRQTAVWFKRNATTPIDHLIRFQFNGPSWRQWTTVLSMLNLFKK